MSIGSALSGIGAGLKAAGAIGGDLINSGPVQAIAAGVAGQGPAIAEERRQHARSMEDAGRMARVQALHDRATALDAYGALGPDGQPLDAMGIANAKQQIADQIASEFSQPQHAPQLMQHLQQLIHPHGAVATGPTVAQAAPLPTPNYQSAEQLANTASQRKIAEQSALYGMKPKSAWAHFLETYQRTHGIDPATMTDAQEQDAHRALAESTRQQRLGKEVVEDPESSTGYSVAEYDLLTGQGVSKFPGVLPPRGKVPMRRVTTGKDQYGNETLTISEITPMAPAGKGQPKSAAPVHPSVAAALSVAPQASVAPAEEIPQTGPLAPPQPTAPMAGSAPAPTKPNVGSILTPKKPTVKPLSAGPTIPAMALTPIGASKQLDADGHIPANTSNANPQIIEFANQLLDDRDVDKIPAKAKAPAAALARQYGWAQGKFTPKELGQIRVASTMVNAAANNAALSIFDNTPMLSGLKTAAIAHGGASKGMLGALAARMATDSATPQEMEYARMYNQLVGTISGLGPTLRSKGMTEATVERLINELPNPLTTQSSADAKEKLKRIQDEINVAMQKGKFSEAGDKGIQVADPTGKIHTFSDQAGADRFKELLKQHAGK